MPKHDSKRQSVSLVWEARDTVGESPVWDERTSSLIWVDILGKRIHRLQPDSQTYHRWTTPDFVTGIGLCHDGQAIVGLTKEIHLWDFVERWQPLAQIEPELPQNRVNECGVAPDGSFWVGTMHGNFDSAGEPVVMAHSTGTYYRVDPQGDVHRLTEDLYGITNTMAWTESHFLTADTTANQIYTYPYQRETNTLGQRTLFAGSFDRGLPDGSCLDREGYLWNCRVGGGACLVRYAPDGHIDRVVELPCSWPTSCTFGGENLETLYVTSARFTMTPEHLRQHPQEGNVWSIDVGVGGQPANRFGEQTA